MTRQRTNCQHCNRSFKFNNTRQRHEQMDCPKRPKPSYREQVRATVQGLSDQALEFQGVSRVASTPRKSTARWGGAWRSAQRS